MQNSNIEELNKDILAMDEKVREIENKINLAEESTKDMYVELGKKTYELHKTDADHESQQVINQINGIYEKINLNKSEIEKLKKEFVEKTMKKPCPHCGTLGSETAQFCRVCGKTYEVEVVDDSKPRFCSKCGSKLDEDSVFCSCCGQRVE